MLLGKRNEPDQKAIHLERRQHPRHTVFKTAILFPMLKQASFAVETISRNGVSGTCPLSLNVHQPVHVSFDRHSFLAADVRWVHGQKCGLLLEDPLMLPEIQEQLTADPGFAKRETRLEVDLAATIVTSEPMIAATVRNLSDDGMLVELGGYLNEGQIVLIRAKGQPTQVARVQWTHGLTAGLSFQGAQSG